MNIALPLYAKEILIDLQLVTEAANPCQFYSLINSVDFHPKKNMFCVTYTNSNKIVLYKNNAAGMPYIVQTLSNPLANLSEPQHAVFSPDGEKIVVANWTNQTLTIYENKKNHGDAFCAIPAAVIPSSRNFSNYKPHGIAISPCGNFLAIAYGAASYYGRAIALFRFIKQGLDCELISVLQGPPQVPGTPKGITFSPDGSCLLVTFSDTNSLGIFEIDKEHQIIRPNSRQIVKGKMTQISRPEDVKITPDGNFCAVTNSDKDTVTFYPFDKVLNKISQSTPCYVLQNPLADLCFPHGIAFSPDGLFVVITQFGQVSMSKEGDIIINKRMQPGLSKVSIYKRRANDDSKAIH